MGAEILVAFDRGANLRIQTVRGVFSGGALVEALRETFSRPGCDPGMNSLWDLREADLTRLTPAEIEDACAAVRALWAENRITGRVAVLASQQVGYGIARMYQSMMDVLVPGRIGVFLDRDEALRWLGEGG